MNKLIMAVAVLVGACVSRADFSLSELQEFADKTCALCASRKQAAENGNWRESEEYTLKLIDHAGADSSNYIELFLLNWNMGKKARAKDFLKKGVEALRTSGEGCEIYAKQLLDKAEAGDLPSEFSANDIYSGSCGITHYVMGPIFAALKQKADEERARMNWIGAYADASTAVYRKQGEMFATQAKFNARREYENKYHSTFDPKDRPSESSGRREDWDSCKKIYDIFESATKSYGTSHSPQSGMMTSNGDLSSEAWNRLGREQGKHNPSRKCDNDCASVQFKYKVKDGETRIGDGDTPALSTNAVGAIVIPPSLGGGNVTEISDHAFEGCSGLTAIKIPSSVTKIGYHAFSGCRGLTAITIPPSVKKIEFDAFKGCSGLTSIMIPSSVEEIGSNPFVGCCGMREILVEEGNKNFSIRNGLLCNKEGTVVICCPGGFKSVTIPTTVTELGYDAFRGCVGLSSVDIPLSVKVIRSFAFWECSGLVSQVIPPSVETIEDGAWGGCGELRSVTIPPSVKEMDSAFVCCRKLTQILLDAGNDKYSVRNGLLCDKAGTKVRFCPGGLTAVTIPMGVEKIWIHAFEDCKELRSVTIPSSVTEIAISAFKGCSALRSLTIPPTVTSIEEGAFEGCSGLGAGVVILDGCVLTVNGECPEFVELPHGTRLIAGGAFYKRTSLKAVVIPSTVEFLGEEAFYGCSGLLSVTIPPKVKHIDNKTFFNCVGLKSVMLPSGVISIRENAFYNCTGIESITIPSSVVWMGKPVFGKCSGLKTIDFKGAPPQDVKNNFISQGWWPPAIDGRVKVRYCPQYESEWLRVFEDCGFSNYEVITR